MKKTNLINDEIRERTIRLVGDNITPGIYSLNEAILLSNELELDLVQMTSNDGCAICRILDYNKFIYEQKKKAKDNEKKVVVQEIKQIRIGPNISQNDVNHKIKSAIEFLQMGDKVKFTMQFKGREMQFLDSGKMILLKVVTTLDEYGTAEELPKLEGKRMSVTLKPKKKVIL